ncbi:MAG: glycosyltransferase family 2 protein [Verrucomicrobiae bacterium]|nr:glycosyltransferase family 2 protein [Verrucomicrobiae bacterium]
MQQSDSPGSHGLENVEVSVVIPCLNEVDTIVTCINKAKEGLAAADAVGEIIVADNGSTDNSVILAKSAGARVVLEPRRGYGNALRAGIAAAKGRFVIIGDADDSYDFREIPKFIEALRRGYDYVQGCRLPSGGGRILPGAMPFLHRWWGNPMFSMIARWWFGAKVRDAYCGFRAFRRDFYEKLNLRSTGMEFAVEMVIRAGMLGARAVDVPITLHVDGRRSHRPHLRTFRDGWRTLRLLLIYSPRWLYFLPGMVLVAAGLIGYALALPGARVGRATLDAHTLLFASLFILCGYQAILFGLLTKAFSVAEGLLPPDPAIGWFRRVITLERGLMLSAVALVAGLTLLGSAVNEWRKVNFGNLDYARTMRRVIPGATLTALAIQTVFNSFLLSILEIRKDSSTDTKTAPD